MMSRQRWMPMVVLASLGFSALYVYFSLRQPPPRNTAASRHAGTRLPVTPPRIREALEVQSAVNARFDAFLAKVRKAESIGDPLQRCLAYPDPPVLHWSNRLTSAYCRRLFVHAVPRSEVGRLIRTGHANELDQRLARAMHEQLTPPRKPDELDAIYAQDFADASPRTRAWVNAWKRQRPHSAFALAASGMAYVARAMKARGCKDTPHTPEKNFRAMHRYLVLARADLDRAVKLDPSMTPAYAAMIHAAGLEGDDAYAANAARRGLAVDPANYAIYAQLGWMEQPKWDGSMAAEKSLVASALSHAGANPLLKLLVPYSYGGPEYVETCNGDCDFFHQYDMYRNVYDEGATVDMLQKGGWTAHSHDLVQLALIYRSEAYRFDPRNPVHREGRIYELAALGHMRWALAEGNAMVKQAPRDHDAYDSRGAVYEAMGKYQLALADYRHSLRLDPSSDWARKRIRLVEAHLDTATRARRR